MIGLWALAIANKLKMSQLPAPCCPTRRSARSTNALRVPISRQDYLITQLLNGSWASCRRWSSRNTGAKAMLNSLSGRFLILTTVFVMLAEVLIFVPSVARFREDFLLSRLERAQIASLALLGRRHDRRGTGSRAVGKRRGVSTWCCAATRSPADACRRRSRHRSSQLTICAIRRV